MLSSASDPARVTVPALPAGDGHLPGSVHEHLLLVIHPCETLQTATGTACLRVPGRGLSLVVVRTSVGSPAAEPHQRMLSLLGQLCRVYCSCVPRWGWPLCAGQRSDGTRVPAGTGAGLRDGRARSPFCAAKRASRAAAPRVPGASRAHQHRPASSHLHGPPERHPQSGYCSACQPAEKCLFLAKANHKSLYFTHEPFAPGRIYSS